MINIKSNLATAAAAVRAQSLLCLSGVELEAKRVQSAQRMLRIAFTRVSATIWPPIYLSTVGTLWRVLFYTC